MNKFTLLLLTCLLSFATTIVSANNGLHYNQINLHASASIETANDRLVTILVVQENGSSPAVLANKVNQRMAAILDATVKVKAVQAQTTSYNSRPIYDKGQIKSWKISQSIKLTSQKFEQLAELVGDLNNLATVQSMRFSISEQKMELVKEKLMKEAINKFRNKSTVIAKQFGKNDYRIVHVSIDSNHHQPQPMMQRTMAMSDTRGAPPALSAGTNKVNVTVTGSIELIDAH